MAPIGTAALIGKAIVSYGWASLASLGVFVVALYAGLLLVWVVVYPAVLKFNGLPVAQFYRNIWPVITLGFVTRSSMGVMPVTEQVTERNLGVPRSYAAFAVPLGATTKMDGCAAVFPALAAIFVAQFYGVELEWGQYLLIIAVSVLGSAATADPYPLHPGLATGGSRTAASHRAHSRHGTYRTECDRAGTGAGCRRETGGHSRPCCLRYRACLRWCPRLRTTSRRC